jgi:hypothetical protein
VKRAPRARARAFFRPSPCAGFCSPLPKSLPAGEGLQTPQPPILGGYLGAISSRYILELEREESPLPKSYPLGKDLEPHKSPRFLGISRHNTSRDIFELDRKEMCLGTQHPRGRLVGSSSPIGGEPLFQPLNLHLEAAPAYYAAAVRCDPREAHAAFSDGCLEPGEYLQTGAARRLPEIVIETQFRHTAASQDVDSVS